MASVTTVRDQDLRYQAAEEDIRAAASIAARYTAEEIKRKAGVDVANIEKERCGEMRERCDWLLVYEPFH